MQTITTILNRRSIRKYITKPVEPEKTDQLLEAAMYAPSARNYRPWHFIVVDERKKLDDLSELHPYAKMLKEAPLAIVVCGDKSIEKEEGYLAINCSAATQNILLSAFDLGLGSVWLGLYPR
nr:nitroreductase family protein [Bacteroidota bacterium]